MDHIGIGVPDLVAANWLDPHGFKLEAVCRSPGDA
jgi:hypothetical protein